MESDVVARLAVVENPHKIALIGVRGFDQKTSEVRVDCFDWHRVGSISNLRDYDTVVLNLLSLTPYAVRWDDFKRVLNPFVASEVLQPGGQIIVVGDPRFDLPSEQVGSAGEPRSKQVDAQPEVETFLDWTFVKFLWDDRPGDTMTFKDDWDHRSFKEYVSHLKGWDYSLARATLNEETLSEVYNLAKAKQIGLGFTLATNYVCRNRYDNALVFTMNVVRTKDGYHQRHWGPIVFLPRIDLSEDETLSLVLKDLCGVEGPLPEPEWIAETKAPGQESLDGEIAELLRDLRERVSVLDAKKAQRAEARQVLRLLFDKGPSLEAEVRTALQRLGATVEEPTEPGKEDGWVSVTIGDELYEGVLEVTGTRGDQFGEDKLRQLLDWIHRGVQLRKKKHKGIFIGSNAIDRPPSERPHGFSPSWERSAELHEISAVKSADLYWMLKALDEGTLTTEQVEHFWRTVFETNGVVDAVTTLAGGAVDG